MVVTWDFSEADFMAQKSGKAVEINKTLYININISWHMCHIKWCKMIVPAVEHQPGKSEVERFLIGTMAHLPIPLKNSKELYHDPYGYWQMMGP